MFPPFRLDPVNECLWREDTRIALAPKAFAVLAYLVEHAGRLVTQGELLEALWSDTYVQPEVLRKYVLEIRRALQDPPKNPVFIETVQKRGYRFIAAISGGPSLPVTGSQLAQVPGKLVGREPAMAELDVHLNRIAGGERQIVFVTGESGIGKTSLVDAFYQSRLRSLRLHVARGQCVEGFGGKEAYYPLLEAFGVLLRGPAGADLVRTLASQAPTWLIQFPALISSEQRALLRQEILGATRERMVREFCQAMESFTADHPLALILEDLHWVDDSTLDLISAIARRRAPAKLILIATYRPVDVILSRSPLKLLKHDLLVHHLCHEISLDPLTQLNIRDYLGGEFPASGVAGALAGFIHRRSDGNPLFMVALLERLQRQAVIRKEAGEWRLTVSPAQIDTGVPETLVEMLEIQLEQLSLHERRLLRAASVAGQRFSAWAIAAITETDEEEIEEICESLAGRQQVLKRGEVQDLPGGSVSPQYEFKHTLYREVLYGQLPPTQRRRFHLRIATRIEEVSGTSGSTLASELSAHFEAGREYPRTVHYLMLSAANAARRYAHSDAIELLHHALDLLPHIGVSSRRELEIEILERISDVLYAQGEMRQSAEIDNRVAELAAQSGFKVAQVTALTRLARALAFLEPDRSVAVCERALEVSRTYDDLLLQARTEMLTACWHIVLNGWSKQDAEICAAARARIHSLSHGVPAYYEILYAHVQCAQGDYLGACQTARAGIPASVENDSLVVYLSAHSSLAQALLYLGDWGELRRVLTTALDIAEKNGNAPWLGVFRATLAWLHFQACDSAGALRRAEELLAADLGDRDDQVRTMAQIIAGFAYLQLGAPDQAIGYFTAAGERRTHHRFFWDWYWAIVARLGLTNVWLAREDWARASQEADQVLELALSTADLALQALAWEAQARIAKLRQEPSRALDMIDRSVAALKMSAVPFAAWRVHLTASEVYEFQGRGPEAEHHRIRAAGILRALGHSFMKGDPLATSLLAACETVESRP